MTATIHPVILAGGTGSRLWPLSRNLDPKQLLKLVGEDSLIQATALRTQGQDFQAPTIVCQADHRFAVAEQMRAISVPPADILVEPVGRNTAPAIAIAALAISQKNPAALLLVLPADHVIRDGDAFRQSVATAKKVAESGILVTFGVVPNRPETGYGYIRRGDALGDGVFAVSRFVEKPDLERAEQYLADGHYLWNSGMFLFRADAVLAEFARWQPEMLARCREALAEGQTAQGFTCLAERPFTACRSVSFDYAVMEMTTSAAVVPADIGWNDVGSWAELWSVVQKDAQGNFLQGDVVQHDGSNNYLRSEGPLLAAVGVENLVIVATSDAVLVCRRDAAQDVKKIVDQLRAEDRPQHVSHRLVKRPWGSYEGLAAGNQFQVKHIIVNPGASLSLQLHHRRSEHWTVVSGQARVTRDSEVFELPPNQSVYIPSGVKHRLENVTDAPLHVIEVQCGSYLGEDDIVRFQDIYGR